MVGVVGLELRCAEEISFYFVDPSGFWRSAKGGFPSRHNECGGTRLPPYVGVASVIGYFGRRRDLRFAASPPAVGSTASGDEAVSDGFSHFVTSMAAPVASGWSDCRVGLSPTGKRRLAKVHKADISVIRNI